MTLRHTTLRHRIRATALACALGCGAAMAVPAMVTQAGAQQPAIHDDPMSAVAGSALGHLAAYTDSGELVEQIAYRNDRRILAVTLAGRLGLNPDDLEAAWQIIDIGHQRALMAALGQLGVPYRSMAQRPGAAFDCSGLTGYAWSMAGISLAHQSETQIRESAPRTRATAQAGDLVQYPGHVMMWLGVGDAIVHAPYTGRTVEVGLISARRRSSVNFADPAA